MELEPTDLITEYVAFYYFMICSRENPIQDG